MRLSLITVALLCSLGLLFSCKDKKAKTSAYVPDAYLERQNSKRQRTQEVIYSATDDTVTITRLQNRAISKKGKLILHCQSARFNKDYFQGKNVVRKSSIQPDGVYIQNVQGANVWKLIIQEDRLRLSSIPEKNVALLKKMSDSTFSISWNGTTIGSGNYSTERGIYNLERGVFSASAEGNYFHPGMGVYLLDQINTYDKLIILTELGLAIDPLERQSDSSLLSN